MNMIGFIPFALPFGMNPQTSSAYIGDNWNLDSSLSSSFRICWLFVKMTLFPDLVQYSNSCQYKEITEIFDNLISQSIQQFQNHFQE